MIIITKQNYPAIYEAFVLIAQDSGRINRLEACGDAWDVPESYAAQLATINTALASLGPETLETFCIGEFSEAEAIRTRYALDDARRLLDAFFEEWIPEDPQHA